MGVKPGFWADETELDAALAVEVVWFCDFPNGVERFCSITKGGISEYMYNRNTIWSIAKVASKLDSLSRVRGLTQGVVVWQRRWTRFLVIVVSSKNCFHFIASVMFIITQWASRSRTCKFIPMRKDKRKIGSMD
jgi:hypothetical protein